MLGHTICVSCLRISKEDHVGLFLLAIALAGGMY